MHSSPQLPNAQFMIYNWDNILMYVFQFCDYNWHIYIFVYEKLTIASFFLFRCALTELFTEGSSPFDLSQLLRYRINDYEPSKVLEKIEDSNIKVI